MNNDETYTPCTKCGRPLSYCKGQCCGKTKGCQCKEYCGSTCAAIRPGEPKCPPQAVIPSLTVESVSNLKDLADCFVHVSDINTTFYIDDKHRIMTTWAGLVSVEDYDFEANPLNLRGQIAYDAKNNIAAIYDKQGANYIFQISDIDNDYMLLENKPRVNGVALEGNKSAADLGIPDVDEVALVFDTVADMKLATNLTNGSYARTLGFHSIDDGGGATYYITDTGTADEASIITIGDTLKAHIVLSDEVIADQFGAYGDDTHDDATAIQKALDYGATNNIAVRLLQNKVYKINSTLTALNDFIMDGTINYTGSGTGLVIGSLDSRLSLKHFKINISSNSAYQDTNSVGVIFYNIYSSIIDICKVEGFYKGVKCIGVNSNGFVYNRVSIQQILGFYIGIELLSDASGWVNENTIVGGRIQNTSSFTYHGSETAIKITSNSDYLNNNNTISGVCCEGCYIGIDIDYGRYNRFYNLRMESVTTAVKFGSGSLNNLVEIGFGNSTVSGMVKPNAVVSPDGVVTSVYKRKIFDSGDIHANAVSASSSRSTTTKVYSLMTNAAVTNIKGAVADGKLVLSSNACVGTFITLDSSDKRIYLTRSGDANRVCVLSIDSEGNVIDESPMSNVGSSFAKYTASVVDTTLYRTGSNATNDLLIQLPANTAKAFVGIMAPSNGTVINNITISVQDGSDTYANELVNTSLPIMPVAPTSVGKLGQICLSSNASVKGWRFNGTSWDEL